MAARGLVAVATPSQWTSCVRQDVVVDAAERVAQLRWEVEVVAASAPARPGRAGLAVDRACFVYHAAPEDGRVERVRWQRSTYSAAEDVLVPAAPPVLGPFAPTDPAPDAVRAVALAVDDEGRLFVVDNADGAVVVYDLADRRLLQRVRLPGRALDVASAGGSVVVLCDDARDPLWRIAARRDAVRVPVPEVAPDLVRIAAGSSGRVWALTRDGVVLAVEDPSLVLGVVQTFSDLEVAGDGSVVVADDRGGEFRRFSTDDVDDRTLRPHVARDYDGRGIVRMPDGSIGFWTNAGRLRRTVAAALRFAPSGSVTAGPLDSGSYGESWGRILVDACVPEGTSVWVSSAASDNADEPPPQPAKPHRMHCRETGPEVPWARPGDDDPYETLEAPATSSAGRYLWVRLELRGTTRATPKVRAMRVEHPGHDLLRRLPRTYSRDPAGAAFLHRYLSLAAGMFDDIERRADERDVLLDASAAPVSVLPWLAGLVGMMLDGRWSERAQRTLVREAACLFRKRGTKDALERMIEIYLDRPGALRPLGGPRIVELFRVRGQGGGMLGGPGASSGWSSSVVGAGLRVGGAAGAAHARPLEGTPQDSFARSAHRFSVVIPALLDVGQERAVRDLLDEHKPAHTAYELCTVGAGMRVGRGLYVELTSIVGPGSGFEQLRVGDALGRDAVLGRPEGGIRPDASRVGATTRLES